MIMYQMVGQVHKKISGMEEERRALNKKKLPLTMKNKLCIACE
jgi:hypothetical protein